LIRRFISFILLLLIAIPLYVVGSVWYTARNTEPVKSDFILVMGAAQFDGRPSDVLKSRLEHALEIYKAGYAPKIYTVGAGAPGDRTTEAAASKAWLIDRGVKKNNVIAVAKGRDTLGSTKAYVEAADKAKLKSVIIVTDPYHCLRSKKMAQDLGLLASCTAVESGPASVANSEFKYLARESGAYLAYITLGRFGINLSDR
jgi:uncharacterized SAM-binding protein YcdF (DUF218 family)